MRFKAVVVSDDDVGSTAVARDAGSVVVTDMGTVGVRNTGTVVTNAGTVVVTDTVSVVATDTVGVTDMGPVIVTGTVGVTDAGTVVVGNDDITEGAVRPEVSLTYISLLLSLPFSTDSTSDRSIALFCDFILSNLGFAFP